MAWLAASRVLGLPRTVSDLVELVAAAAWALLIAAYLRQGARQVLADLRDTVAGPFVTLALIVPMLLGAALYPYAAVAGEVIVGVFAAVTVLAGGLLTGQTIAADVDPGDVHPGYFLPTATGGFVAAATMAQVGFRSAAWAAFGVGVVSWLMLGSLILNRLFSGAQLPDALTPTLAIELAPPAVGGLAWLALGGSMTGTDIFGGYTVLMALVQVRMIPKYARLRFGPNFWAFTFAYAATASYALDWLNLKRPAGYQAYAVIVLALITGFIGTVAVRSLILLAGGPVPAAPAPARRGG
jgi:tellurite resistance protein